MGAFCVIGQKLNLHKQCSENLHQLACRFHPDQVASIRKLYSKGFEPGLSDSRLCSVIVQVRVDLKRAVVACSDFCSGCRKFSHCHQLTQKITLHDRLRSSQANESVYILDQAK